MTFYGLLKSARNAQLSDGDITLTWQEALSLAERGEMLEMELDAIKRDIEQVRVLRHGLARMLPATPNVRLK